MLIEKNTVSAANQMVNSSDLSFLGDKNAKRRILVVGNSITRHGPCKEIGWDRDWGMAASSLDKDYVHRLFNMLDKAGQDVYIRVRQAADWEQNYFQDGILFEYDEDRAFDADVVVFRLGENISMTNIAHFYDAMKQFIEHICPNGKVVYTTCFWENPMVDETIKRIADERGEVCINGCFSKNEKNMALGQFEHEGVSVHPSDAGMEEIAKAIFNQLKQ